MRSFRQLLNATIAAVRVKLLKHMYLIYSLVRDDCTKWFRNFCGFRWTDRNLCRRLETFFHRMKNSFPALIKIPKSVWTVCDYLRAIYLQSDIWSWFCVKAFNSWQIHTWNEKNDRNWLIWLVELKMWKCVS